MAHEGWKEILAFWFEEVTPEQHFVKDSDFDATITRRFQDTHTAARRGELADWRLSGKGRLAEIIVLDQFSRNMFREKPLAFAQDAQALALAQEAVAQGGDGDLPVAWRLFMYLPYMHSESPLVHKEAMRLFDQPGLEPSLEYEIKHKRIIDRFGRYPHRNKALGRDSTAEEIAFLKEPDSSF